MVNFLSLNALRALWIRLEDGGTFVAAVKRWLKALSNSSVTTSDPALRPRQYQYFANKITIGWIHTVTFHMRPCQCTISGDVATKGRDALRRILTRKKWIRLLATYHSASTQIQEKENLSMLRAELSLCTEEID